MTAVYEEEILRELWLGGPEDEIRVGDIYIGKVKNIVPNLRAAFVEFAKNEMGYYPLDSGVPICFLNRKTSGKIASGDEILVQVAGEIHGSKEWKLTGKLTFTGRYAVYDLNRSDNGVSAKIKQEQSRQRLLNLADGRETAGWLIRTAAEKAKDGEIREEMDRLYSLAQDVQAKAGNRTCYSRLYRGRSLAEEILGRAGKEGRLTTDLQDIYHEMKALFPGQVRLYDDPSWPLIKLKGLENELDKAIKKKVWLKSGGFLVIEQTEAMTVIDVNSGKSIGKKNKEEHLFRINSEAAEEALRQIRLRNLSGIIVIDLINMKSQEHIGELAQLLKSLSWKDPVQTTFVDITRLQIAELTRKKVRKTLAESI